MPRLRIVSPSEPGWARRRRGRGFYYVDQRGNKLEAKDVERCKQLVIPPAWQNVWICPFLNGHLQAVGIDDAGRKQYLYHEEWRRRRDEAKHDRVLEVAARLPGARRKAQADLQAEGMPYRRALATAFRLLDLGLFRVGGESYADENGSYGLATIRKQHVRLIDESATFDFPAKSGQQLSVTVTDHPVQASVAILKKRRGGGAELLAYKERGRWRDVTSIDINGYIKNIVGDDFTAKDFRTWHGTVIAAIALAAADTPTSATARKRAVSAAMRVVADHLGNTPAVARSSYVDHRVIDLFNDGITISLPRRLGEMWLTNGATQGKPERAVLDLLRR